MKKLDMKKFLTQKIKNGEKSYGKVADAVGCSRTFIFNIVNGDKKVPKDPLFYEKVANLFGVSPLDFREYETLKTIQYIIETPEKYKNRLLYDIEILNRKYKKTSHSSREEKRKNAC